MELIHHATLHGRVRLTTYEQTNPALPVIDIEQDNVLCSSGLTALLQGILWSSIEDVNASIGSPFSTTYIAPVYGAIGTGSNVQTAVTDTILVTETTRVPVSNAGYTAANQLGTGAIQWLFLFPTPAATLSITEVGVFVQASAAPSEPVASSNPYGSLLDHAAVNPAVTQTTTQLLTLSVTINIA